MGGLPIFLTLLFLVETYCDVTENCDTSNPSNDCAEQLANQIPFSQKTTPTRKQSTLTEDNIKEFYETITKGNGFKEDLNRKFEPFNDMDKTLMTAPLSVQFMATLSLIAAETDPDFRLDEDYTNFKYLNAPSSFKATMGQIGNEGFLAFRAAHNAMHVINLRTSQFSGHLKKILRIVFKRNNDQGIKIFLPITLGQVRKIVKDSTDEVNGVVNAFERTLQVIYEALEASLAKQGRTQRLQAELKKKVAREKELKKQFENRAKK